MNNKDFLSGMAARIGATPKEVQQMVSHFAAVLADTLEEGDTLPVQGFGSFEVKKKMERVVVNPATKQRQLVPPKLAIAFKPSPTLKDKIK